MASSCRCGMRRKAERMAVSIDLAILRMSFSMREQQMSYGGRLIQETEIGRAFECAEVEVSNAPSV